MVQAPHPQARKGRAVTQAFPLQWPAGLPRTRFPKQSAFGSKTIQAASDFVRDEVRRMGGSLPIVSTNLELRRDGLPYSGQRQPSDRGAAVYFQRRGKPMVFACDQWGKIEHNLYAIGKTIEALRGIERWGSSDLMERAFVGFEALPAPEQWWQVLGVSESSSAEEVNRAYREKARTAHPDSGGSDAAMARLNAARAQALSPAARDAGR